MAFRRDMVLMATVWSVRLIHRKLWFGCDDKDVDSM